eukprot:766195-Hanusia_phi.AAC.11
MARSLLPAPMLWHSRAAALAACDSASDIRPSTMLRARLPGRGSSATTSAASRPVTADARFCGGDPQHCRWKLGAPSRADVSRIVKNTRASLAVMGCKDGSKIITLQAVRRTWSTSKLEVMRYDIGNPRIAATTKPRNDISMALSVDPRCGARHTNDTTGAKILAPKMLLSRSKLIRHAKPHASA